MRIGAVACVVAVVAGCSIGCDIRIGSDPATGPLPIGAEAIIYRGTDDPKRTGWDDMTSVRLGTPKGTGVMGLGYEDITVGTRVRVVGDATSAPTPEVPVRVCEGPLMDRVGSVPRKNLRPIPR